MGRACRQTHTGRNRLLVTAGTINSTAAEVAFHFEVTRGMHIALPHPLHVRIIWGSAKNGSQNLDAALASLGARCSRGRLSTQIDAGPTHATVAQRRYKHFYGGRGCIEKGWVGATMRKGGGWVGGRRCARACDLSSNTRPPCDIYTPRLRDAPAPVC